MATLALIGGFLAGIAYGSLTRSQLRKERNDALRDLAVARQESAWRAELLAKKVGRLCECGEDSEPAKRLPVEPVDKPAELWDDGKRSGGEGG